MATLAFLFQERFHAAMETSQRVVVDIVEQDYQQMTMLLNSMQQIIYNLNESSNMMKNFSNLAEENKAVNVLTGEVVEVDNIKRLITQLTVRIRSNWNCNRVEFLLCCNSRASLRNLTHMNCVWVRM